MTFGYYFRSIIYTDEKVFSRDQINFPKKRKVERKSYLFLMFLEKTTPIATPTTTATPILLHLAKKKRLQYFAKKIKKKKSDIFCPKSRKVCLDLFSAWKRSP